MPFTYDLLIRDGSLSTSSEKRTAIDIAGVIDLLSEMNHDDLRELAKWVPTTSMIADHMTKVVESFQLRSILERGLLHLVQISPLVDS